MQQAVSAKQPQDTSWWRSLVYGRACKLSNWTMFWMS